MWNQKYLLLFLFIFLVNQQASTANCKQQVFGWAQRFTKQKINTIYQQRTITLCWLLSSIIIASICHVSYLGYKIEQKNTALQKFYDDQANNEITLEAKFLLNDYKKEESIVE